MPLQRNTLYDLYILWNPYRGEEEGGRSPMCGVIYNGKSANWSLYMRIYSLIHFQLREYVKWTRQIGWHLYVIIGESV